MRYLAAQSDGRAMLTLAEIEAIIGAPLPAGARRRHWWISTSSRRVVWPVVRAAGWRLVLDGFWGRTPAVTFVRDIADGTPAGLP